MTGKATFMSPYAMKVAFLAYAGLSHRARPLSSRAAPASG